MYVQDGRAVPGELGQKSPIATMPTGPQPTTESSTSKSRSPSVALDVQKSQWCGLMSQSAYECCHRIKVLNSRFWCPKMTHIHRSVSDCCHRINVIVIITWNVRGYFRCREQQSALRHAALRSSEIRCMCADGLKGNQLCENWLSPSSLGAVRLQMSLEKNG